MKVYTVDDRLPWGDDRPVAVHHEVAYHGEVFRCGQRYPAEPHAHSTNELREPLDIVRSKHFFPDLTKPSANFIVSERVKRELEMLPNVEFLPVVFEKLVDFYFEKGDMSYLDEFGTDTYVEPDDYILQLPDDPEAHRRVGRYYEVLSAENEALLSRYSSTKHFEISIGPTEFNDPVECDLSPEMVCDFPVIWAGFGVILSEHAFRILEPYIDWDYFRKGEFEL